MLANGNQPLTNKEKNSKIKKLEKKFGEIIDILGYDRDDPNLIDTPKRIAKMYINEIFCGNFTEPPKITVFPNTKNANQLLIVGPMSLNSICVHHFLPFIGECYIGYIPKDKVIGISKFSRIMDWFMRRPQIQEELVEQIADFIQKELEPLGCGVYISSQHTCMKVRGVREANTLTKDMALRGNFYELPVKTEFLSLISK